MHDIVFVSLHSHYLRTGNIMGAKEFETRFAPLLRERTISLGNVVDGIVRFNRYLDSIR